MIRDATPQDALEIATLWSPWITGSTITFNPLAKSGPDVAQMIQDRQAQGYAFKLGCAQDGRILGFASYSQFRAGLGYAKSMEHTIILSPQARGSGLGRSLMTSLEDHAKAAGYHTMIGCVSAENPAGRAFHLALGYELWGSLPQVGTKFGRYIDLWILGKLL